MYANIELHILVFEVLSLCSTLYKVILLSTPCKVM